MINKKVAITIITYNSAPKLPDCLMSLSKIDYPLEQVDFIFVDNNSSDNSLEIVKSFFSSARIIKIPPISVSPLPIIRPMN